MKKIILVTLLIMLLALFACGKKTKAGASIEQIQQSEGVPVKVQAVAPGTFSQELIYNATLTGAEESTSTAMLADVITRIHARIGDRVNAGQLIVSFPANSPQAQNDQARTGFENARLVYERMQRLFGEGAISQQDLDNARAGYDVARANLAASDAMIKITAPFSGVITNIMVAQGERSYPGQPLFTIAGGSGFKAVINVPESDIAKIRRGMSVQATWNGNTVNGRVSQIALALDPNRKAFRVEALFPASGRGISYGVTAQVKLIVANKPNSIVVERQHIITENAQKFVWVAEGDKAIKRPIETGQDNQLSFEVISGLSEGDQLITQGMNLLTDNALIKIIP